MTRLLLALIGIAIAVEAVVQLTQRTAKRDQPAPDPPEPRRDDWGWRPIDPETGRIGEPVERLPVPWLYGHRRDRKPVRWP